MTLRYELKIGKPRLSEWWNIRYQHTMDKKGKKKNRTWKVPEALDFWTVWVFISRQGVLFECVFNTHPLLTRSLACSHFLFDAGAIVLSGSCCFYWVANPPLLHPQRWKLDPVCGNVVSKPLSKKTPIIIALCENYISHASLWSELRGFLLFFFIFLVEEQRQTVVTKKDVNKLSLSVVVHWVPHSVGLHCSDSVCLHDYWKVSLLHGANRITLFCSGIASSLYTNLHTNYTVIVSRYSNQNLILTGFLKVLDRDSTSEVTELAACYVFMQEKINIISPKYFFFLFKDSQHKILNLCKPTFLCFTELPKLLFLHYSGLPSSATLQ